MMRKNKKNIFLRNSRRVLFGLTLCFSWHVFGANPIVIPDVNLKLQNTLQEKHETYFATTQFTRSDVTHTPVINLNQFLQQEQSVVRLTNNSGDVNQTALSLRGFGDNAAANSLILVDGFLLINPSLLAPNFNSIPLPDIERIDIFQGSEGSLWGNQAVGGVVNIVTKHPKKFFVNSIISAGSYSSVYDTIFIGDKAMNGLFYKLFGLMDKSHHYRNQNKQHGNNLAVQIGLDYARGIISFNLQTYGNTTYLPGGLSEKQFKQNPRQATLFNNYGDYQTKLFQLLNKEELTEQWILETRLDHHTTDANGLVYSSFSSHDGLTSVNPRLFGAMQKNKIIIGYDGQLSYYTLINSKVQKKTSANQNDFYFQTTIPVTDQIEFILGARKAWQNNRSETSIKIPVNSLNPVFVTEQGVIYHSNQMLSFFVRRDGNFSFPKANEETWLPENINSLRTQTGTSYETGAKWQAEKQKSQISIYHLELNNEIAFDPTSTPMQPLGTFNNLDKTVRQGMSLSEIYHLTKRITLNGQINYVNARFASGINAGKWLPAVPAINGNVGLNYNLTERWATQYNLLYTGSRYPSQDRANVSKQVSAYWLSDVALQYFIRSLIFSFEINNLFNKQYAGMVFYNTFLQQNKYYPAVGRNYLLTLKINID